MEDRKMYVDALKKWHWIKEHWNYKYDHEYNTYLLYQAVISIVGYVHGCSFCEQHLAQNVYGCEDCELAKHNLCNPSNISAYELWYHALDQHPTIAKGHAEALYNGILKLAQEKGYAIGLDEYATN